MVLALMFWLLLARILLSPFDVKAQFAFRFIYILTHPIGQCIRWITPSPLQGKVFLPLCLLWVLALRMVVVNL